MAKLFIYIMFLTWNSFSTDDLCGIFRLPFFMFVYTNIQFIYNIKCIMASLVWFELQKMIEVSVGFLQAQFENGEQIKFTLSM